AVWSGRGRVKLSRDEKKNVIVETPDTGAAVRHRGRTTRRTRCGVTHPAMLLLAMLAAAPAPAGEQPRLRLEVGKPVERPTRGGITDLMEFVLPQGGFARLQVDQFTAGVRVAVRGPDGREIDWTD